ncbi:MAG: hypothetical protein K6E50_08880 [Lachnospiraceae bacterium]|nr:hypothetical protein [Lachnospiraceae bacterium]
MLKKRLAALLLTFGLACGLMACADDEPAENENEVEEGQEHGKGGDTEVLTRSGSITPMRMSVNRSGGTMTIERPESMETPMVKDGSWTIFVYICGSNLESESGCASWDIDEMCAASASDKVRFVVETGGAENWLNDYADADSIGRFLIRDGEVVPVGTSKKSDMGDPTTLTDFLKWGISEYPAERMGVVFWNHGGGSISGVCFDDLYDHDSLSLREIDSSLYSVFEEMPDRFEFIGFDACLMGTVETANILASYARYMVASEESEPGYGWDYTMIGDYLAENPTADGDELGKVICEGFYKSCEGIGQESAATLSVIDLDKIDDLVKAFNDFANEMYEASADASVLSTMIREIGSVDNFGGNNRSEGYTNMVDLGGLINACSDYANCKEAMNALQNAVVYMKNGLSHKESTGLSLYYPLCVQGSMELGIFEDVSISPYYSAFVDRQDFTSSIWYDADEDDSGDYGDEDDFYYDEEAGLYYFTVDDVYCCYDESDETYWCYDESSDEWLELDDFAGEYDYSEYDYESSSEDYDYDDDYWFDDDVWESCWNYDYDDENECYLPQEEEENDHWAYADDFETTGESKAITFLKEPSLDKNGTFSFTLDAKGIDHAADVYGMVFQYIEDSDVILALGETFDVYGDWETGHFEDGFDGYWLSLPDGQNLYTTIVSIDDDYVTYTAPIRLNGKDTNLRMTQSLADNSVIVEGTWDGIDESGASARQVRPLEIGDEIVPLYTAMSLEEDDDEEQEWEGYEYVVDSDFEINYAFLDPSDYYYAFCIDDIYYDYYISDFVRFNVDDNGDVSYYED